MLEKARSLQQQMITWRRDFHMYPELSFAEVRTASKIAEIAAEIGYRVRTGVGKTGVVAEIGEGKPVVAIRADMDALPISESNKVPYKSKTKGVMHACGHDVHIAIALGAAKLLSQENFPGIVRFIFQPAEEVEDEEGLSGAPRMIEDGAIKDVSCVLALHVDASLNTGEIKIATEYASAGVDTFYIKILGKGGHGSTPHKVIDPIFISGHLILAIHGIVSRRLRPFDPAVISIGTIQGGQLSNVISEEVNLSGTIRFLNPIVQQSIHTEIENFCQITRAMGGDYELKIQVGYPPMHNHIETVDLLKSVAADLIGNNNIITPETEMGAEDFGFFLQKTKGAMFMLGCKIEGDTRRHHDPKFDVNENCMPIGAAIFSQTALRILRKPISTIHRDVII
ncbi:MAG: amidohydrolase [Chloroflexi bacterium HGW-Chloroflexi-10]|nr:MAG: amidohydrolase [Chloroflexi bacterium HGW-Chloroflexi-10]